MRLRNLVVGIVFSGIIAAAVFAQNAGQGERARRSRDGEAGAAAARNGRGEGRQGFRMTPEQQVERLNKEITLTQEQQDKIRKLIADQQDKMREQMRTRLTQENRDKMTELRKQLDEAEKAGEKEKVAKLETQLAELTGEKERAAAREKLMTDVEATLTADQKTKFQQIKDEVFPGRPMSPEQNPQMLRRAVESLKLPNQKADKINAMIDECIKSQGSQDRATARAGAADLYKKVMAELSPEEQAKVKAFRGYFGEGRGQGQRGNRRGNPAANAPGAAQ